MARPTDYTPEIQAAADAYVDGGFIELGDVVPSRAGLAVEIGCSRQTLKNWEVNDEFLGTLDRLSFLQERISLNGGLKGDLNSTIVKLLLANHGYSDKVHQDVTSSDGSMTPKDHSAAVLEALQAKHK